MNQIINVQHLIPIHKEGSQNDAVTVRHCESETAALQLYEMFEKKLLDISNWKINAGNNPAEFILLDEKGMHGPSAVKEGHLVRIKLPGPKNRTGNGYDWVKATKVRRLRDSETPYLMIQLVPHSYFESADRAIAHFYTSDSSNTFILALSGSDIQLSVHGRNEKPNTQDLNFPDRIRNLMVAGGGIFGGSKMQWQNFADEFLK